MNLLIDIGNTNIKWAEGLDNMLSNHGRYSYNENSPEDILEKIMPQWLRADNVLIANVRGDDFEDEINQWATKNNLPGAVFLKTEEQYKGLINAYTKPEQLGVDRWLLMLGAQQYSTDAQLVISLGTAITIDYIDNRSHHLGGYIVPGIQTMATSLGQQTAGCGHYTLNKQTASLEFGVNSEQAITQGIILTSVATIEKIVTSTNRTNPDQKLKIFITGGDAPLILPHLDIEYQHLTDLLFHGMMTYC